MKTSKALERYVGGIQKTAVYLKSENQDMSLLDKALAGVGKRIPGLSAAYQGDWVTTPARGSDLKLPAKPRRPLPFPPQAADPAPYRAPAVSQAQQSQINAAMPPQYPAPRVKPWQESEPSGPAAR